MLRLLSFIKRNNERAAIELPPREALPPRLCIIDFVLPSLSSGFEQMTSDLALIFPLHILLKPNGSIRPSAEHYRSHDIYTAPCYSISRIGGASLLHRTKRISS